MGTSSKSAVAIWKARNPSSATTTVRSWAKRTHPQILDLVMALPIEWEKPEREFSLPSKGQPVLRNFISHSLQKPLLLIFYQIFSNTKIQYLRFHCYS